jgi:hypothetical protein
MASRYLSDGSPDGKVTDYTKYPLEFCSMSTDPSYFRLFYKFKVHFADSERTALLDSNERRYDVSGIELYITGDAIRDYGVKNIYKFTGYAAGYGPDADAESTLDCDAGYLETIELKLEHTFYRTQTSSKGTEYRNQLDTVYFSVPEEYFTKYGTLQRIKAEWYEYKTKEIIVSKDNVLNANVPDYIGTRIPAKTWNSEINRALYYHFDSGLDVITFDWAWNSDAGNAINNFLPSSLWSETLYYFFPVSDIKAYDYPYSGKTVVGGVPGNVLYDYIKGYTKTHAKGYLPIKHQNISADLFEDDIDEYRKLDNEFGRIKQGYSYYDFDAAVDLQKL